ncbi:MAG: hypothetical protein M3Q30_26890, partial [Actinomycetota bacterium]|nr:hypothetical protein [Actinomycetota bacterium]
MGLIATLVAFSAGTLIKAADFNTNFNAITTAFNNTAVLTDVARTITVAHTFAADILFADATYDIGKSGATRPRDLFLSRNLVVGGVISGGLSVSGGLAVNIDGTSVFGVGASAGGVFIYTQNNGPLRLGTNSSARWDIEAGGNLVAVTDATYDFGTAANRPRDINLSRQVLSGTTALLDLSNGAVRLAPAGSNAVRIGSSTATGGTSGGELVMMNARAIIAENAAATTNTPLIGLDSSDRVVIGSTSTNIKWGTQNVALG